MSIFSFFYGKSAEAYEREGDSYAALEDWGRAKIAYDSALDKLGRRSPVDGTAKRRLEEKTAQSREALAEQHHRDAVEMVDGGAFTEARELVQLGLELSADSELRSRLKELLEEIDRRLNVQISAEQPILSYEEPEASMIADADGTDAFAESDDEYFQALCAALPEEVQEAYRSYGEDFTAGYLALNDGEFETAADLLHRAMQQNPFPDSYIPLELATANLNLGRRQEALELLLTFVQHHPGTLPAYQMLCDLYWEDGAFDQAERLLAGLPPLLADSVAAWLLKGETRFRAGDVEGAKALYERFISTYGWNEGIARSLARTHEALSQTGDAIHLYGEMMKRCSGCGGGRVDPEIKQRFVDLSFAAGDRSSRLLEIYLSLAQEAPDTAPHCYEKISRIYAAQGNEREAQRFRSFAARAGIQERVKDL
jgi:tetratricopeptide (TPR) repeat protein